MAEFGTLYSLLNICCISTDWCCDTGNVNMRSRLSNTLLCPIKEQQRNWSIHIFIGFAHMHLNLYLNACLPSKNDTNIKGLFKNWGCFVWCAECVTIIGHLPHLYAKALIQCSWDHVYILHTARKLCTNLFVKGQTHYKTLTFTTSHDFILFSCEMTQLCVFKHVQTAVVKVNIIFKKNKVDKANIF